MCDIIATPATASIPLRRGRKPKVINIDTTIDNDSGLLAATINQEESTGNKVKRGRKPKQFYVCGGQDDLTSKCMSDDENIVLNLKVFDIDSSNKKPIPFNNEDYFLSKPSELNPNEKELQDQATIEEQQIAQNEAEIAAACEMDQVLQESSQANNKTPYKVVEILKDFEEKNKQNEWPSSTSIHCYWCCHKFNNVPYGIPVKHLDGKFHVFGCFCSLECAAAYNMKNHDSVDEMWERYMLINMLSRALDYKKIVKPAPSKLSLKAFGGHMDIDEFRSYCETSKVINVNFPPMMTLTQQIEEINESDLSNDLKYIPIDTDRINKYKEKMKLKRQKPITNFKNTLDHAMNLKIV